jgi:hypothetical protein
MTGTIRHRAEWPAAGISGFRVSGFRVSGFRVSGLPSAAILFSGSRAGGFRGLIGLGGHDLPPASSGG